MENLLELLNLSEPEFIKFWYDISLIESPTEYKTGVDSVAERFVSFANKMNWQVEKLELDTVGDPVVITMNHASFKRPISLSGHIDTVHSVGSFGEPCVRIENNKMFGPGVMDCKGGTVAALYAMYVLDRIGYNERPIQLLLQTDEEVNSLLSDKKTIEYICDKAKDSEFFLNCESIKGDTAVLFRKGIIRFCFKIKGKAIHASRCAEGGASAILDAAHKIIKLEGFKDNDGITCTCGIINGGSKPNTVPEYCEFIAEFRFASEDQLQVIRRFVDDLAKNNLPECSTSVEEIGFRYAMEKNENNYKLLESLNEIYKRHNLPVLSSRGSLGGSDAADVTVKGIPCIDSIGVAGDFIHTASEFAYISSLKEAASRIAYAIYYFDEQKEIL